MSETLEIVERDVSLDADYPAQYTIDCIEGRRHAWSSGGGPNEQWQRSGRDRKYVCAHCGYPITVKVGAFTPASPSLAVTKREKAALRLRPIALRLHDDPFLPKGRKHSESCACRDCKQRDTERARAVAAREKAIALALDLGMVLDPPPTIGLQSAS